MSASTRSTRSSSTVTKRLLLAAALCIAGASTLPAQNIRNHYVSKAETDGVIYHTFPVTLFENREAGDLTFDITYKEHRGGRATINFTCRMAQAVPADSVRFAADAAVMSGPVDKLYLEPEKKQWKHLRCRRVGTLRLLRRAGFARGDGLRRGKAVRLSRQTLRMAQLRADRVSDIRYDSCKRTVVFGSRGHLSPCFVRSGREMRLYLLSGPDCVMAKSASGHSKTEGCRFSVHGAASRGPEAMHPASCAGVKKTTGPEMNRVRSLFSGVYG